MFESHTEQLFSLNNVFLGVVELFALHLVTYLIMIYAHHMTLPEKGGGRTGGGEMEVRPGL